MPSTLERDELDRLLPLVYPELRVIAHRQLKARSPDGTLSTTGLVHEAYLKLAGRSRGRWNDRGHFLALASVAMRHILVNRARDRTALKRGGDRVRATLDEARLATATDPELLLDLDDALTRLTALAPRLARVVECRFFGGLSPAETAEALSVTVRTVERDWTKAKLVLRRLLVA